MTTPLSMGGLSTLLYFLCMLCRSGAFTVVVNHCERITAAPMTLPVGFGSASRRFSSPTDDASPTTTAEKENGEEAWYEIPEDAVIQIRPNAMRRLDELRDQQKKDDLYLRMGVKSGGCSGMSYVMDFCEEEDVTEDDVVDEYESVKCVVDPKSVLYLYGLELDYSSELIGGGFKVRILQMHTTHATMVSTQN